MNMMPDTQTYIYKATCILDCIDILDRKSRILVKKHVINNDFNHKSIFNFRCGKVCLSLLGTWEGQKGEQWNEKTSTVLQVS